MKIEVNSIFIGPHAGTHRLAVIEGKSAWWGHFISGDAMSINGLADTLSQKTGGRATKQELIDAMTGTGA